MRAEQDVEVSFTKAGSGWANCKVRVGAQQFTMASLSYTTDAIGDLIRAALQIATGGGSATVSFDREPAEWRIRLQRSWEGVPRAEVFRVRISESDCHPMNLIPANVLDHFGIEYDPETVGREAPLVQLFEAECDPDAFARAVLAAGATLRDSNASAEWWHLPFPSRAYSALEAALALPREVR
jgi:hypothetical protein